MKSHVKSNMVGLKYITKLLQGSMHALTAKLVFIFTAIVLALDHFDIGTLLHSVDLVFIIGTLIVTLCIL